MLGFSAIAAGPIAASGIAPTASISASAAATLGSITSVGSGKCLITAVSLATLGGIGSMSAGSLPIAGVASRALGGVSSFRSGRLSIAGFVSPGGGQLGTVVGAASGAITADPIDDIVAPGWSLSSAPRLFTAAAVPRVFSVSSNGCKSMLNFPPKYAHEVRHAVIDFAAALSEGETLTGTPTVAVMRGDIAITAARIDGAAVRFTLSAGTAASKVVQSIEVHCATSGAQVLEEVVSVTMLS